MLIFNDTKLLDITKLTDDVRNIIGEVELIQRSDEFLIHSNFLETVSNQYKPYISTEQTGKGYHILKPTQLMSTIINEHNSRGQTALYVAALCNNKQMFDLLLTFGADIKTLNEDNGSVLHGIAWGKDESIKPNVKENFIRNILSKDTSFMFNKNNKKETFYNNLQQRHHEMY